MDATIRINTDLLNNDIIEGIKKMFPHKLVAITVQEADATDEILSNPAYAQELLSRISEFNETQQAVGFSANELCKS